MHFTGLGGVPRRYYSNTAYEAFNVFVDINVIITIAAIIGGLAQLIFALTSSTVSGKEKQNRIHGIQIPWNGLLRLNICTVTGRELFLKFTVGHMTMANPVRRKIISRKPFLIRKLRKVIPPRIYITKIKEPRNCGVLSFQSLFRIFSQQLYTGESSPQPVILQYHV